MKRKLFFIVAICSSQLTNAQVGIGTREPERILHIDPQKNSDGTLGTTGDDVVVTVDGKMGIGTINPSEKLQVEGKMLTTENSTVTNQLNVEGETLVQGSMAIGTSNTATATVHVVTPGGGNALRIEDNTFSTGKYLTSDKDGNAYWDRIVPETEVVGYDIPLFTTAQRISTTASGSWGGQYFTYVNITDNPLVLSEGVWLIIARYGVRMNRSSSHSSYRLEDMIWTKLEQSLTGGSSWTEVITEGTIGEIGDTGKGTTSSNRMHSAIPQVTHILNVVGSAQVRVLSGVICGNNNYFIQTVPANDTDTYIAGFEPVFVAVRLNNKPLGTGL